MGTDGTAESMVAESGKFLLQLAVNIFKNLGKKISSVHEVDGACETYYTRYLNRHGNVKVLGMPKPISLADLYVEVLFLAEARLKKYKNRKSIEKDYLARGKKTFDSAEEEPVPGLSVANRLENQFLLILGAPGSGKTTFLKFLGLAALQGYKRSKVGQFARNLKTLPYSYNLLPVYLPLRELSHRSSEDIARWVDEEFSVNGFPSGFGQSALEGGHCLILLDGIDELPEKRLDRALSSLVNFIDQYSKCRFVASCRTAFTDYRAPLRRFTNIELADFSEGQIEEFIRNWFSSEEDLNNDSAGQLWRLLSSRDHSATFELAKTPLLASFVCLAYESGQSLPTNRCELYESAFRILFEKWAAERRVHNALIHKSLTGKREISMLEFIAGPAFERERYFFKKSELAKIIEHYINSDTKNTHEVDGVKIIDEIEKRQGLLVERANDLYTFSHLTLQEYLAASHYYKEGRSFDVVQKHLTDDKWREVFLLLAGFPNEADSYLQAISTSFDAYWKLSNSKKVTKFLRICSSLSKSDKDVEVALQRRITCALLLFVYMSSSKGNYSKILTRTDGIFDLLIQLARTLEISRLDAFSSVISFVRGPEIYDTSSSPKEAVNYIDYFERLPFFLQKADIFNEDKLVNFYSIPDRIQMKRPDFLDAEAGFNCQEYFMNVAHKYLKEWGNLDPFERWNDKDVDSLALYIKASKLLIDAKISASRVTKDCWDSLCCRLFLPPKARRSRRHI